MQHNHARNLLVGHPGANSEMTGCVSPGLGGSTYNVTVNSFWRPNMLRQWLRTAAAGRRCFLSTNTPTEGIPWDQVLTQKRIELYEPELEESFVKGWGKGGQKINKVRNCVHLKHLPTGLAVRCQKTRKLEDNRRVARKLLKSKLDDLIHGENSTRNLKIAKLQKRKARQRNRSNKKYNRDASNPTSDTEEDITTTTAHSDEANDGAA